jgi:hypothetical protein
LPTHADLHNILNAQWLSYVIELYWLGFLPRIVGIGGWMNRELFVMAQRKDSTLGQEASMMNRAMVDDLHQGVILVCHCCVIDINKPVSAARK